MRQGGWAGWAGVTLQAVVIIIGIGIALVLTAVPSLRHGLFILIVQRGGE